MQKMILLADDDPAVRRMLCRVLAEENYCVIAVEDADDALEKIKNVAVDLILVDLTTPERGAGETLFRQIKNVRPSIPVILISSQHSENPTFPFTGIRLEKPLDLSNLVRTIGKLFQEKIEA